MQKIKIEIQEEVQALLKEVQENVKGYNVHLGGGYLRDQYCNLNYKDIDIFLTPNGEEKSLVIYTPKGYRVNYQKNTDETGDMRRRGVGALIGMYNLDVEKETCTEVQYIIYDKPMTQKELVKDMDMNINQVMWNPSDDLCMASAEFVDGHEYTYLEFEHHYDEIRMYMRLERMKVKFPCYSYDDVELSHEQELELHERGEKEFEGSC